MNGPAEWLVVLVSSGSFYRPVCDAPPPWSPLSGISKNHIFTLFFFLTVENPAWYKGKSLISHGLIMKSPMQFPPLGWAGSQKQEGRSAALSSGRIHLGLLLGHEHGGT